MSNHDRKGSHPSSRDPTLERAWREASDEQPPAHLDAAIVAEARQSVAGRGQQPNTAPDRIASRTWLKQWQSLAAAASVAGLAFVLVQMLPREHDRTPPLQRQESAPVVAATESLSQGSPARAATDNSQASSADKAVDAHSRTDDAPPAVAAAPAPTAVPAPPTTLAPAALKTETAARDSAALLGESSDDRRQAVAPETANRGMPAAAAAPSTSAMASERNQASAAPLDAAAWAARIATLHAAGDVTAAANALRKFRAAEPDADTYLPESLRSWAQTVQ